MSNDVRARPPGDGWVWVEEFGGGKWVQYPVAPVPQTPRDVLRSVLYGPGYQGPPPTRSTTGVWTVHYPTAGCR